MLWRRGRHRLPRSGAGQFAAGSAVPGQLLPCRVSGTTQCGHSTVLPTLAYLATPGR